MLFIVYKMMLTMDDEIYFTPQQHLKGLFLQLVECHKCPQSITLAQDLIALKVVELDSNNYKINVAIIIPEAKN